MNDFLKNTKSLLAKLLAGENISVQHKRVRTASFDVKNRVLVLPIYKKDISECVYDTFVAHEVGHALWTPASEVESIFKDKKLFQYVNLVEDIRIEKRIKNKFGGLTKRFVAGYNELWSDGFFGVTEDDVPTLPFSDRLNLNAKIGLSVDFTPKEQELADKAKSCLTFADVIDVAKLIRDYEDNKNEDGENQNSKPDENCKEDGQDDGQDDGENQKSSKSDSDKNDDGGDTSKDDESDGSESESESGNTGDEDDEEDFDSEANRKSKGGTSTSSGEDGYDSGDVEVLKTQKNFDSAIESAIDEQSEEPIYLKVPTYDLSKIITPLDDVISAVNRVRSSSDYFSDDSDFNVFKRENLQVVNHLLKQFEMKKAAALNKKASESKSGTLDVNKVYRYAFDDNVFKRNTIIPEGKNHGLVLFLDWSGSMHDKILATVQQTLNLVFFCKKAGIVFDLYAFSDGGSNAFSTGSNVNTTIIDDVKSLGEKNLIVPHRFTLLHLISSTQSAKNFNESASNLYWIGKSCYNSPFSMVSTPLNSTIIVAPQVVKEFREKNRLEVVHAVILSDGAASDSTLIHTTDNPYKSYVSGHAGLTEAYARDHVYIVDGTKNFPITISKKGQRGLGHGTTIALLNRLKEISGVTITGFFLTPGKAGDVVSHALSRYDYDNYTGYNASKLTADFKKDKGITITNCGYDELHFIASSYKDLSTDVDDYFDIDDDVDVKVAVRAVKNAFKKIGKEKNTRRVILNRFIDLISKPKNII